jgi:NAD(P)-dependent dehydrogenase (short-subunit alcohol dehydrogenase family)
MVWQERVTPGRFDGRTVIVTGAASGIGRATASRITREGGRVIAVDISADRLDDLITSLSDTEGSSAPRGRALTANVAGVNDDFSSAHETSDAIWDRVLGINLTGSFKLTRAVLPTMLAAGRGAIVNVSSEAGLRGNASGTASITFLLSDDAVNINGAILPSDGGWSVQ